MLGGTADAALFSRLGGDAVYDDDRNITWLGDGNLIASQTFGLAYNTQLGNHAYSTSLETDNRIIADGSATWGGALHWIDAMNAHGGTGYLGYSDWRLPFTDSACDNFNCTDSDLGHLFYDELGGSSGDSILDANHANLALFSAPLRPSRYWSDLESSGDNTEAWNLDLNSGRQSEVDKVVGLRVIAVRTGDVVPSPAMGGLIGVALLGWLGSARRRGGGASNGDSRR